ncbi:MAG TPA: hypothetical protein VFF31_10410 [Blastocatellia bacterium]|nr:hypothetical protein [Blastocatellia bacterium]
MRTLNRESKLLGTVFAISGREQYKGQGVERVGLRKIVTIIALMLTAFASEASAQDCKKIHSLPYIINVAGHYCVSEDLSTSISSTTGAAIEIRADNVLLDLGGFTLTYIPPDPTAVLRGIRTVGVRRSVTVRNGTIKGFILAGVYLGSEVDNAGNLVEDLRVQDCVGLGIGVWGKGNIVRDNHVVNTVGNAFFSGASAIGAFGSDNMVINNDLIGTTSAVSDDASASTGILFNACNQCVAEKNRIVDTESPNPNSARAIHVLNGSDVLVVNNRIIKSVFGIVFGITASGLYRDNIANACTVPYSGGTNLGNNQ